jgi:anti-sigma B factor antagonist
MKEVAMSDSPYQPRGGLLRIGSERDADVHHVALDGEMDGSNARDVEDELIRIEASGVSLIVLDLASLEFIDSTGLAVLHRAHRRMENNVHRFAVKDPQLQVKRVFELSGLDQALSFVN